MSERATVAVGKGAIGKDVKHGGLIQGWTKSVYMLYPTVALP